MKYEYVTTWRDVQWFEGECEEGESMFVVEPPKAEGAGASWELVSTTCAPGDQSKTGYVDTVYYTWRRAPLSSARGVEKKPPPPPAPPTISARDSTFCEIDEECGALACGTVDFSPTSRGVNACEYHVDTAAREGRTSNRWPFYLWPALPLKGTWWKARGGTVKFVVLGARHGGGPTLGSVSIGRGRGKDPFVTSVALSSWADEYEQVRDAV